MGTMNKERTNDLINMEENDYYQVDAISKSSKTNVT